MELLIIIICSLFAASKLCQFFVDYKKERFFLASIELIFAIIFITCFVCIIWNSILQVIA